MNEPSSGPQTTKHEKANMFKGMEAKADSRTDREEERCIKGIPIRQFCDEVFKQDRRRRDKEGTLEEYPIQIAGIGLHAIQEKQKAKNEMASGNKPKN